MPIINSSFTYYHDVFLFALAVRWVVNIARMDLMSERTQAAFAFVELMWQNDHHRDHSAGPPPPRAHAAWPWTKRSGAGALLANTQDNTEIDRSIRSARPMCVQRGIGPRQRAWLSAWGNCWSICLRSRPLKVTSPWVTSMAL